MIKYILWIIFCGLVIGATIIALAGCSRSNPYSEESLTIDYCDNDLMKYQVKNINESYGCYKIVGMVGLAYMDEHKNDMYDINTTKQPVTISTTCSRLGPDLKCQAWRGGVDERFKQGDIITVTGILVLKNDRYWISPVTSVTK